MFKRPSIVTKAGSLPEIVIDGRSGFVSDRDVSEFSEKMREIIKNNLWRKMGNSAYESSKRFRISVVAREMESQLYQINNITL
jgi:glycosyltransferase involved in cell wall biosynthesis